VFTVTKYEYKGQLPRMDTAVSFNIQQVILLANPNEDGSATEDENDEAFQPLGVELTEEVTMSDHDVDAGPTV
jgi:hypothetical protein